jgi:hypothetical protein
MTRGRTRGRNWCRAELVPVPFPKGGIGVIIGVSSVSHDELVRPGWKFELTPFVSPTLLEI